MFGFGLDCVSSRTPYYMELNIGAYVGTDFGVHDIKFELSLPRVGTQLARSNGIWVWFALSEFLIEPRLRSVSRILN